MRLRDLKLAASLPLTLGVLACGCGGDEPARPISDGGASDAPADKASQGQWGGSSRTARERRDLRRGGILVSQSGPGDHEVSSSQSPGARRTVSTTGLATLSFIVKKPSRLAWKNSGDEPFSASGRSISIFTKRGRGETELPPGTYTLSVSGAAWTIAIRPR